MNREFGFLKLLQGLYRSRVPEHLNLYTYWGDCQALVLQYSYELLKAVDRIMVVRGKSTSLQPFQGYLPIYHLSRLHPSHIANFILCVRILQYECISCIFFAFISNSCCLWSCLLNWLHLIPVHFLDINIYRFWVVGEKYNLQCYTVLNKSA